MARGGYRKPANPASVSGPGALSRRTDGNPTQAAKYMAGGKYGEGQAMLDLQRQAPMAAAPTLPTTAPSSVSNTSNKPILGIYDLTERPDVPVTNGAELGPGAGTEVLKTNKPTSLYDTVRRMAPYDTTGDVDFILNTILDKGL
jgi:hypothetical protein